MKHRKQTIIRPTLRQLEVQMRRMARVEAKLKEKNGGITERLEKRKAALKGYVAGLNTPFVQPPKPAEFKAKLAAMEAELANDPNYIGTHKVDAKLVAEEKIETGNGETVTAYMVEPDTQGIKMLPDLDTNCANPTTTTLPQESQ